MELDPLPLILKALSDKKGIDIKVISLTGKSPVADAMVVVTGMSTRHVQALAENVLHTLENNNFPVINIEGIPSNHWVLLDTGDIIVHVFLPEMRIRYNLEKMWCHTFEDIECDEGTFTS